MRPARSREVTLHVVPLVRVQDLALRPGRARWRRCRTGPEARTSDSRDCRHRGRGRPPHGSRPRSGPHPVPGGRTSAARLPGGDGAAAQRSRRPVDSGRSRPLRRRRCTAARRCEKPAASLLVGEPTGPGSAVTIMRATLSTDGPRRGEACPTWGAPTRTRGDISTPPPENMSRTAPQGPRPAPGPSARCGTGCSLAGVAALGLLVWVFAVVIAFQVLDPGAIRRRPLEDFYSALGTTDCELFDGLHHRGLLRGDRPDQLLDLRGAFSSVDYEVDERINRQGYAIFEVTESYSSAGERRGQAPLLRAAHRWAVGPGRHRGHRTGRRADTRPATGARRWVRHRAW